MPTPAISGDRLVMSDGSGTVTALDVHTGHEVWSSKLGGMGNMSSPAIAEGKVFVGMSSPAFLFSLDEKTGRTLWKATLPKAANTSMGDVSPAVADGVVVTDAVSDARNVDGKATTNFTIGAFDANTGKPLWTYKVGRGAKPPSYKGGVPMIHKGTVYVGSPVDNTYQAFDLHTGKQKWRWSIPNPSEAGSGRGPATYLDGKLYIATGPSLYVLDAATGKLLGRQDIGGRFGIAGPTVVGGTLYVANTWDWVLAMPLAKIVAAHP
jgi:polyvinyl alcohol dehydrogenase (cytochrome)